MSSQILTSVDMYHPFQMQVRLNQYQVNSSYIWKEWVHKASKTRVHGGGLTRWAGHEAAFWVFLKKLQTFWKISIKIEKEP